MPLRDRILMIHVFIIDTKRLRADLHNNIFCNRQNNCTYLPTNNTFLNARIMPPCMLKSPAISNCKRGRVLNACNCCFCIFWDKKNGFNFYKCPTVTREAMVSISIEKLIQVNFSKSNPHTIVLTSVK